LVYERDGRAFGKAEEARLDTDDPAASGVGVLRYNTLDLLTKSQAILRLTIDPTAARYDAADAPHPHFFCRICQRVYDIELPQARPSPDEAAGHKIEAVQTYAYGICAACRRKQNEEGIDA